MVELPSIWKLFRNINDPLVLVDSEFKIRAVNQAFNNHFGSIAESCLNHTLSDYTCETDRTQEVNAFIDLFYGKKGFRNINKCFMLTDTNCIRVNQTMATIPSEESEPSFAVVIINKKKEENRSLHKTFVESNIRRSIDLLKFFDEDTTSSYHQEVIYKVNNLLNDVNISLQRN